MGRRKRLGRCGCAALGDRGMRKSESVGPMLALVFASCVPVMQSAAAELTIDRLFDAPALAGPSITGLKISPDNSRINYLQGKPDDKNRLDLWEYEIATGRSQLLVDANTLAPPGQPLATEELLRRERQRTTARSGIQDYFFVDREQSLVLPVDCQLYYVDPPRPEPSAIASLSAGKNPVTDASV